MNSLKLTSEITVIANALACGLTPDEISLLSAIFVQLGDTLATISAQQSLCGDDKQELSDCKNGCKQTRKGEKQKSACKE